MLAVLLVGGLPSAPLLDAFDVAFVCRTLLLFGGTLLDKCVGFLAVSWEGGDIPPFVNVPSCPDIDALRAVKDVLGRPPFGPRAGVPATIAVTVDEATEVVFPFFKIIELCKAVLDVGGVCHLSTGV